MIVAMATSAHIVAWTCFAIGLVLLLIGTAIGLVMSFRKQVAAAKAKLRAAIVQVEALGATATQAANSDANPATATAAGAQAAGAKSALEDLNSLIASLPENLRFAGLLILVGALLMSVATVQFGGHSIF